MKWLRLYNDTITDPKWRVVATESGQPLTAVLAVWMSMLVNASDADERGTLQGWNDRFAGAALDLRGDAVRAIREAMQGVVLDGMRLTGWDKRQFASDNIAERVKRHRTKAKDTPPGGGSTNGTGEHRNVTNAECNVTPTLRNVTVTEKPLDLSYLPSATPTLKNEKGGGGCARAHEVCERVAGLTGLPQNVATAEAWLAEGFDPERDIYPAVLEVTGTATGVGSMNYFTKAIRRHHAARISPPQESSNVHPIRHAGSGQKQSGGRLISRLALGLPV
jgi:hypothetical protein